VVKCKPMRKKLEKYVVNPNGCHVWTGALDKDGYGRIRGTVKNVPYFVFAHRAAYEEYVGPIPEGKLVLHKCDTPMCINPEHLYIGDSKDNGRDAVNKPGGFYKTDFTRWKASVRRSTMNNESPQQKCPVTGQFVASGGHRAQGKP
jgi:HNH endonuclease